MSRVLRMCIYCTGFWPRRDLEETGVGLACVGCATEAGWELSKDADLLEGEDVA